MVGELGMTGKNWPQSSPRRGELQGALGSPSLGMLGLLAILLFSGYIRIYVSNKEHSVMQQVIIEHLLHARHFQALD